MPRSSTWVEQRKSPEGDKAMLVGGASTRKISSSLGMKREKRVGCEGDSKITYSQGLSDYGVWEGHVLLYIPVV